MTSKRDYYDILGVNKSATLPEIKKAYRQKALEFHPDRNKATDAEAKFKEVNEAYEILSDTQKRATYDQFGHAAFSANGRPASGWDPFKGNGSTYYYTSDSPGDFSDFFGGFRDPFDIFATVFGGQSPFHRGPQKPHYSLKISFRDAALGAEKELIHQGKKHTIKIPAGADDGTRMRFTDFDVSFDVQSDATFKRDGYDLFLDQAIPFPLAALGGQVTIPTLEQDLTLKIRSGTQTGSMLRLSGKGVKHLQSSRRGDLYVRLLIQVPQKLTRQQKHLLQQLQDAL